MEIEVFLDFLKNKRLPYFKKISASSKLKKVQITNVLVNFLSVLPLLEEYHYPGWGGGGPITGMGGRVEGGGMGGGVP